MAQLVTWASEAWVSIQSLHDTWGFLWAQASFNTASGTSSYIPASDFNYIDTDRVYCDGTWMIYIPFTQAREYMHQTTSGKPTHFTILPTKEFRPFPTPDAVYTVSFDYWKRPVVLAANGDTPAIDADLHSIIKWRAMLDHASFFGEQGRIAYAQMEYAKKLSNLERRYLPPMEDGDPLV